MADEIDPQARFARNPAILFNDFDDGIIMMDIEAGTYFDIDAIGSRIWTLLDQPAALADISAALCEEYSVDPATCLAETGDFLAELTRMGLIRTV